jgi:hypothetical protein
VRGGGGQRAAAVKGRSAGGGRARSAAARRARRRRRRGAGSAASLVHTSSAAVRDIFGPAIGGGRGAVRGRRRAGCSSNGVRTPIGRAGPVSAWRLAFFESSRRDPAEERVDPACSRQFNRCARLGRPSRRQIRAPARWRPRG